MEGRRDGPWKATIGSLDICFGRLDDVDFQCSSFLPRNASQGGALGD